MSQIRIAAFYFAHCGDFLWRDDDSRSETGVTNFFPARHPTLFGAKCRGRFSTVRCQAHADVEHDWLAVLGECGFRLEESLTHFQGDAFDFVDFGVLDVVIVIQLENRGLGV